MESLSTGFHSQKTPISHYALCIHIPVFHETVNVGVGNAIHDFDCCVCVVDSNNNEPEVTVFAWSSSCGSVRYRNPNLIFLHFRVMSLRIIVDQHGHVLKTRTSYSNQENPKSKVLIQ